MPKKTILEPRQKGYYVKKKEIRQEHATNNSEGADQQIIHLSRRKSPHRRN